MAVAIGILVMFIVGAILAIKFFVTSAEEKAKVKESLVPYFVGCAVVVGAFTIWDMVVNIGQDVTSSRYGQSYSSRTFTFYVGSGNGEGEVVYCESAQDLIDAVNIYRPLIPSQTVEIEYENPNTGTRSRISLSDFLADREGNSTYDYCLQYFQ